MIVEDVKPGDSVELSHDYGESWFPGFVVEVYCHIRDMNATVVMAATTPGSQAHSYSSKIDAMGPQRWRPWKSNVKHSKGKWPDEEPTP